MNESAWYGLQCDPIAQRFARETLNRAKEKREEHNIKYVKCKKCRKPINRDKAVCRLYKTYRRKGIKVYFCDTCLPTINFRCDNYKII